MKTNTIAIGVAFALSGFVVTSAFAAKNLNDSDCDAAWTMASPHGETLSQGKSKAFVINYTMVDKNADGAISQDEFKEGCKAGQVNDAATAKRIQASQDQ